MPISPRARLFGGDACFEVVAAVAAQGRRRFHGATIAAAIGRTDAQTQRELAKLLELGVVVAVGRHGRRRLLRARRTQLARAVLALPALIEAELHRREHAAASERHG